MLTRDSLLSLETYARQRNEFRARVIEHKKRRNVHLGEHVLLQFEDELTIRYQVQEMLRIERIFEDAGIQGELDAYNPLIPDGSNWKATMLIEYPDEAERRRMLGLLRGIERRVWAQVAASERVYAIADEDLGARTTRKPRRCISCASNWRHRCARRSRAAPGCRWASIILNTASASKYRPISALRSRRTSLEVAACSGDGGLRADSAD